MQLREGRSWVRRLRKVPAAKSRLTFTSIFTLAWDEEQPKHHQIPETRYLRYLRLSSYLIGAGKQIVTAMQASKEGAASNRVLNSTTSVCMKPLPIRRVAYINLTTNMLSSSGQSLIRNGYKRLMTDHSNILIGPSRFREVVKLSPFPTTLSPRPTSLSPQCVADSGVSHSYLNRSTHRHAFENLTRSASPWCRVLFRSESPFLLSIASCLLFLTSYSR